ncbi:adenosylhomocysteinase [Mesoaciditoga lauensis]|uniref:adenosylhomocysteinase n=1 Tax=Mesoaciditoga lauensis TaxID=1495039 RepID=UPI000566F75A|nr:adenosylhomocysteinase [Mesoaciditoga lauensis]
MDIGSAKLEWVAQRMEVINTLVKKYEAEQPLKGVKVAVSVHLEAKTGYLALSIAKLGADVTVTGSNPLSTQDEIVAELKKRGLRVNAERTHDVSVYENNLQKTLDFKPNVIVDDGADLTVTAHEKRKEVLENLWGVCEETTSGVKRIKALENFNKLAVPAILVNDAATKHLFDNRYGTGQSVWDSIMRNTNMNIAEKRVVVAGYGWCGKGVAMRAKGLGARVIVTEVDEVKSLEAFMDGFEVMPMKKAAEIGDIFVTVTGNTDVIRAEHFEKMKDGAILTNAGHFDVEVSVSDLKKVATSSREARPNVTEYVVNGKRLYLIGEGRLVNLAAADGHPVEIMDLSFAVQLLSVLKIARDHEKMEAKTYAVPPEIDYEIASTKLKLLGIEIDTLTEKQKKYLNSW